MCYFPWSEHIFYGVRTLTNMLLICLSLLVFMFSCLPEKPAQRQAQGFNNPILAGYYPDPSICRVGSDYYLVNSTFAYFPGITVFHSKDLTSWELIGHVLDRAEQMDLEGLGVSRGIFAPAIRYYEGIFYVTCTLVDGGGNFVVTASNPAGPWSNPTWLPRINGIDPSPFFDENGEAYIVYNSVAPDEKPLYEGHRTIRITRFDPEKMQLVGEEIILVNGGVDLSRKPIWIEGPHIFQKDGFYYLMAAEGGTADQHSEVVFRSTEVTGPYVPYENNPILTQRHLDPQREFAITSTGHADLVETESDDWWAVFLGCRPYRPFEENYYNTGRETFLSPVKWIDGWPVINPDHETVQYSYPYPVPPAADAPQKRYSGNFKIRDEFDSQDLHRDWIFLRTPHEKWYDLGQRPGFLTLKVRPESCSDPVNPSFLGHRQQHLRAYAATGMDFVPQSENEKAGLLIFQNESHFYFLCKSLKKAESVVQLFQSASQEVNPSAMQMLASQVIGKDNGDREISLKIAVDGPVLAFYYGFEPGEWILLKDSVDAMFLSTRTAGGFVGCVYALYATSLGMSSQNLASFDWFEYQGDDEVYKRH